MCVVLTSAREHNADDDNVLVQEQNICEQQEENGKGITWKAIPLPNYQICTEMQKPHHLQRCNQ